MTMIGSTAYYTSASNYGGANKASEKAYEASVESKRQEAGPKAGTASKSSPTGLSTVILDLQGKLTNLHVFDLSNAKQMDIAALPEDRYKEFMEGEQQRIEANTRYLENQYSTHEEPDLSNYAGLKPYADVVIGGKVVATIDNQGVVSSDGALGKRLKELLSDLNGTPGPDFAQQIADQIANLVGGRVLKSDTALSQSEFNALPSIPESSIAVDRDRMRADPLHAQIQSWKQNYALTEQRRSEYLGRSPN